MSRFTHNSNKCVFLFLSCSLPIVRHSLGVMASSNIDGNNGSLATIENRTSSANNSHYNGTINELIVSETIPSSDGIDAEHMVDVEASLSSLSLTRVNNNNSSSGIVSPVNGALNKENAVHMPTVTHAEPTVAAATAATLQQITTTVAEAAVAVATILNATARTTIEPLPTVAKLVTIHTTIAPLNGGHITNHMQTSQFIASSNARRDYSSAAPSTIPITTNKPRKYIS